MNKQIKMVVALVVLLLAFTLVGCGPKTVTLSVPVVWTANQNFNGEIYTWYAGIVEGIYTYLNGMPNEPFEYISVTPGTNETVEFTFEVSDYNNFTVFTFMDKNEDGKYDDGDTMNGYELVVVGPGDVPTDVELTPYF